MKSVQKQMSKPIQMDLLHLFIDWLKVGVHKLEFTVAVIVTMVSGFIKYMAGTILLTGMLGALAEACLVAAFTGFSGAAGAFGFKWAKAKYTNWRQKTKNK